MVLFRILQLTDIVKNNSIFLLGPRRTGKSTLLKSLGESISYWNLLDSSVYRTLSGEPSFLGKTILGQSHQNKIIVIDEIQKLPILLDEVDNLFNRI